MGIFQPVMLGFLWAEGIVKHVLVFLLLKNDGNHGNLRYPPPKATPPINKALLRDYEPLGGVALGGVP